MTDEAFAGTNLTVKILYITSTLPALTVTFIYHEIFRLQQLGFLIDTVSMNTPSDDRVSAEAKSLRDTTLYLDQQTFLSKLFACTRFCVRHPLRTMKCLWQFLTAWPMKFPRDYFRMGYHLIEAGYLAYRFRANPPDRLHSHFINGPTSIGMFLGMLLERPFSFTMHASLIWMDPIGFSNKLRKCVFCVSISEYNKRYVLERYGKRFRQKIHVVHCGVDPDRMIKTRAPAPVHSSFRILGVGQLNPRKGFHVLIPALATLRDQGLDFYCTIIGEGAERSRLESLIDSAGLHRHVHLAGAALHEDVLRQLSETDVFVLPCIISREGFRDGIPVALMEAMQQGLPVVSSNILGLPELIDDGQNGFLVAPEDPVALAGALINLAKNADLRSSMGAHGRAKVLDEFNNRKSALALKKLFDGSAMPLSSESRQVQDHGRSVT